MRLNNEWDFEEAIEPVMRNIGDFDPDSPENKERGIELYGSNDKFFRKPITPGEYASLVRRPFDSFDGKEDYLQYTEGLSLYVFIDMHDILQFLRVGDNPGYSVIDVKTVADVACDFLGEDSNIGDVLWNSFEEEISSEIQARLGAEDEAACLMGEPFNDAVGTMYEVATMVQNYLVNARFPLVETESVYTAEKFEKGLLVLRLRTWEEFVIAYVGE
ncbi:hypothetical protein [Ralstonia phage RP31]|uniref:Uncharacterized protein n=2 Tax=Ripduovirus RP12 TaxID=2560700 RepID=A0A1L7N0Y3_9CAUD|nr:hypothetical protein FDH28_gp262 [Ralstonia phage RP12]BAW19133.1 hypothetical protein [Ralstonia phage RP12]BAW19419.1 hypothetical protein [Ralstonia phage RP31]